MASETEPSVPEPVARVNHETDSGFKKPLFKSFTSERNLKRLSISGAPLKVDTSFSELSSPQEASATTLRRNTATPVATPLSSGHLLENEAKTSNIELEIDGLKLTVPLLVHKCCSFVLEKDPEQGIFRINGSIKKIKKIESLIKETGIDNFDFESARLPVTDESEDTVPNVYDAAMILKRWLSGLSDGLITLDVSKALKNLAVPSPSKDHKPEAASQHDSDGEFSVGSYKTDPSSVEEPDSEANALQSLPIINLHLFIYLLSFFNKLTRPEICEVTKMPSSNLAKIFQMSFFKADDFQPIINASASTEELLQNYKANEELLENWISSYESLVAKLKAFVSDNELRLKEVLASPLVEEPLLMPKQRNKSTSDEKQQKRRSMFGYRSFSSAFSSKNLSQVLTGSPDETSSGKRSVSDSAATNRYPTVPQDIAADKKLRRRSMGWFTNGNGSTPSLTRKQGEALTPVNISSPFSLSADNLLQPSKETDSLKNIQINKTQPETQRQSSLSDKPKTASATLYDLVETKENVPVDATIPKTPVSVDTLPTPTDTKPNKKNNRLSKMFSVRFGLSKMIH
ncbi:hypothetical protein OGAPHI_000085 [Ogataea philodendri]|uniref:Rho-GAP domain-containing protein n=1 Tax=Ogataea philodendri TaxID=1378263 RepID=A0A9P8TAR8_9ASCO|nr:uncharacterized protein OGAPHI_000085 [Ogataea philodendri]KAH3671899.1 hypothetical protein OGAPHI_000085 [Ogataea philodendri]